MTSEQLAEILRKRAEKYGLSVEWRGDDYGARKKYYEDAYLAGANDGIKIGKALKRVESLEANIELSRIVKEPFAMMKIHKARLKRATEELQELLDAK